MTGISETITLINKKKTTTISSSYNEFSVTLDFNALEKITKKLLPGNINKIALKIPANFELADPQFNVAREIDILIGTHFTHCCQWNKYNYKL